MYCKTKSENLQTSADKKSGKSKKSRKSSNYYQLPKGFVANPFNFLHQDFDVEISDREEIINIYDFAVNLDKKIEGDFELEDLTSWIRIDMFGFVKVGLQAFKTRALRLYKDKYNSFTEYCHKDLKRSRAYIDRQINASRVVIELIKNGFQVLPTNESQCRLLSKFTGSELIQRWRGFLETIEPHKITAQAIAEFLSDEEEVVEPEEEYIKLPGYLANYLGVQALRVSRSVQELVILVLNEIFQPPRSKSNWRDFEKEEIWLNDLDEIVDRGRACWEHIQNNSEYTPNTT